MTYPIVTAQEAIDQGLQPAALFSIARFNERMGNIEIGRRARLVGRDMARIIGLPIGGQRRSSNDNVATEYGKPRNRRAV